MSEFVVVESKVLFIHLFPLLHIIIYSARQVRIVRSCRFGVEYLM